MLLSFSFFFFNDTATTEIYTLSLHDALPISCRRWRSRRTASVELRPSPRQTPTDSHMRPPAILRPAPFAPVTQGLEHFEDAARLPAAGGNSVGLEHRLDEAQGLGLDPIRRDRVHLHGADAVVAAGDHVAARRRRLDVALHGDAAPRIVPERQQ